MKIITKKDTNFIFGLVALVLVMVFSVLTVTGEDGILRLMELKRMESKLQSENRALLERNLAYRQEIKSLYQMPSIEARARESLGWVHPDEIIYVDSYAK